MEKLSILKKYCENETVILLNTENMHWVRMNKKIFNVINEDGNKLYAILSDKFNMFETIDCEVHQTKKMYLQVTNKCNMKCPFCCLGCSPDKDAKNDFKLENFEKQIIPYINTNKIKQIIVSGGEPLVRKDINQILKLLYDQMGGERITLQTNGLFLNKDRLLEICSWVDRFEISIEHIFFDDSLVEQYQGIMDLLKIYNKYICLSYVIYKDSEINIKKAIDFCHNNKAYFLPRIVSYSNDIDELDKAYTKKEILDLYRLMIDYIVEKKYFEGNICSSFLPLLNPHIGCGAGHTLFCVNTDLSISLCPNIKEKYYDAVQPLLSDDKQEFDFPKSLLNSIKCKKCNVQYFCPGPCTADSEHDRLVKCTVMHAILEYMLYYTSREMILENKIKGLCEFLKNYNEKKDI